MIEEKAYKVTLSSGVTVLVQPLSIYEIIYMRSKAAALFPDPDKAPYQGKVENAIGDGVTWKNKAARAAYEAAVKQNERERIKWIGDYLPLRSVVGVYIGDDLKSKSEVIAYFANDMAVARKSLGDKIPADEWDATLAIFIIRRIADINLIEKYAVSDAIKPISAQEVAEVGRSFRRDLWWR